MSNITILNKGDFKNFFLELLEEDETFYERLVQVLDWKQSKSSESKAERIKRFRNKYALKKESILNLQELFEDEPPAEELVKMLEK